MRFLLYVLLAMAGILSCANKVDPVLTIEMHLSAFGVESDDFPSIDAVIDLSKDFATCYKSYYNPKYGDSIYVLRETDMQKIRDLLRGKDLSRIKRDYTTDRTDQPSYTTTFHMASRQQIVINDYGRMADAPMQELYRIVYKY